MSQQFRGSNPPDDDLVPDQPPPDPAPDLPRLQHPRRGRRLAKKPDEPAGPLTAEQRLLVLDAWQRSGLPARDFAPLVGISSISDDRVGRESARGR